MSVETVFAAAAQKPSAERAAYLDEACGSDAELRRKVERTSTRPERIVTVRGIGYKLATRD